MNQQNTAAVLDVLMYVIEKYDGTFSKNTTYQDIVENLQEKNNLSTGEQEMLQVLQANMEEMRNFKVSNPSWKMGGYSTGSGACTFLDGQGNVYIAYRGTGDGEWPDNGIAYGGTDSKQQEEAAKYFEEVIKNLDLQESDHIIITGHSKGGNKSQYVTLTSENRRLIDECYSLDGQGFSDEAVKKMTQSLDYEEQLKKIHGVNGENDYIHKQGNKIVIPEEQTLYIPTPSAKKFENFHEIQYMFKDENGQLQGILNTSDEPCKPGPLAEFSAKLAEDISALPKEEQVGCANAIMQFMEMMEGGMTSLNGGDAEAIDYAIFLKYGLPILIEEIKGTDDSIEEIETIKMLKKILNSPLGSLLETFVQIGDMETLGKMIKSLESFIIQEGGMQNLSEEGWSILIKLYQYIQSLPPEEKEVWKKALKITLEAGGEEVRNFIIDKLQISVKEVERNVQDVGNKAIEEMKFSIMTNVYFATAGISGAKYVDVNYDPEELERLKNRLYNLANKVDNLDKELDYLYMKLLQRDIEQGENVFTCLADLFYLCRADIVIDNGVKVRRYAQRLEYGINMLRKMEERLK